MPHRIEPSFLPSKAGHNVGPSVLGGIASIETYPGGVPGFVKEVSIGGSQGASHGHSRSHMRLVNIDEDISEAIQE